MWPAWHTGGYLLCLHLTVSRQCDTLASSQAAGVAANVFVLVLHSVIELQNVLGQVWADTVHVHVASLQKGRVTTPAADRCGRVLSGSLLRSALLVILVTCTNTHRRWLCKLPFASFHSSGRASFPTFPNSQTDKWMTCRSSSASHNATYRVDILS